MWTGNVAKSLLVLGMNIPVTSAASKTMIPSAQPNTAQKKLWLASALVPL